LTKSCFICYFHTQLDVSILLSSLFCGLLLRQKLLSEVKVTRRKCCVQ